VGKPMAPTRQAGGDFTASLLEQPNLPLTFPPSCLPVLSRSFLLLVASESPIKAAAK
jgi:hypothetical protein